jgi:hypothetical protein
VSTRRSLALSDRGLAGSPAPAPQPRPGRRAHDRGLRRLGLLDPLEAVALVALQRREQLLAQHRHRLRREELEDCYSQATLELLARARRPDAFAGAGHIANALAQRLRSRIYDRHRALAGRSPIQAATARAVPIVVCDGSEEGGRRGLVDLRADVERTALLREQLARIAHFSRALTRDQRLRLASELYTEQSPAEFCAEHGWSPEKYRKVGQRARSRLAELLAADSAVPVAGVATPTADAGVPPIVGAAVPVGGDGRIYLQDQPMTITRPPHRHVPRDTGDRHGRRSPGAPADRSPASHPGRADSPIVQRGRDRESRIPPSGLPVVRNRRVAEWGTAQ